MLLGDTNAPEDTPVERDRRIDSGAILEDCFLCLPDSDLLIHQGRYINVIAGLGPIVQNYCVVSSRSHVVSLADLFAVCPGAIDEIVQCRQVLEARLGPILLTEHGRVPVCRNDRDEHERHCYHAHALLFPKSPSIEISMYDFYLNSTVCSTLPDALEYAKSTETYALVSYESRHIVFTRRPIP
jgi:hypothetical protein